MALLYHLLNADFRKTKTRYVEVEIVTREDLENFRIQLLSEIRKTLTELLPSRDRPALEGLKTQQVRKILGCSYNTLVALRISRKIRTKKVGGTLYYNREDVRKLVEEGF